MDLPAPVSRAVERWKDSRLGRTLAWYGARNGPLLCGGIAYSALFSLFAGLTIGWSVFSASLGRNAGLRDAVLDQVDTWVPGLVGDGPKDMISPDKLVLPSALTWATVVAAVVLLVSALGVMGALRSSVRAMFDLPAAGQNPVLARVWQLAGFALLGVGVVASAGASVAAGAVGQVVESWLGGSQAVAWAVRLGGAAVGVALDAVVVVMIITVVGGARPTRRDLVLGSLAAGVVAGALRWLGTTIVVGSAGANRLLAPFAAIVTILVLVNFVARLLLLTCAWMHDPPRRTPAEGA
ncbi:YhjD/YihY/BrkB family envelope integrity protein [Xylanimonas protaetiae]|uniref:YhjD/YihY/BrkB family envelope integrity protein n=1 Tax=Xylanimonas protaetiae TaxID=2509457 RepID=UPI001F5DBCC0|nr:YhjD/YihY/BrkB family envelope integrity protein [Xylanimonas protaetiae]